MRKPQPSKKLQKKALKTKLSTTQQQLAATQQQLAAAKRTEEAILADLTDRKSVV